MKTENYVKIGDRYYAKGHNAVKAQQETTRHFEEARGSIVLSELPRSSVSGIGNTSLNKTEQRYFQILKERFPFGHVQAHTIKLQLAEKCWYLPDFSYVLPTGALVFVETKGAFERDDAIVKLKTAARQFPQFTFIKAKYVKGKWTETVMPK